MDTDEDAIAVLQRCPISMPGTTHIVLSHYRDNVIFHLLPYPDSLRAHAGDAVLMGNFAYIRKVEVTPGVRTLVQTGYILR